MRRLLLSIVFLGAFQTMFAQDPHYSQFYMSPMTLNPATTGLMSTTSRIYGNYRNQWATITTPYSTVGLGFDAGMFKKKLGGDIVGMGLQLTNDQAGDGNWTSLNVAYSLAYHKSLNRDNNHFLSFAAQAGFIQRSLDFGRLFFDRQFNGDVLDGNLPSGEVVAGMQTKFAMDFGAGINWSYTPQERSGIYIGASMFHINQPSSSFLGGDRDFIARKLVIHAGGEVAISDKASIMPQFVYIAQGPHNQFNGGALFRFLMGDTRFKRQNNNAFYIGATVRLTDGLATDAAILQTRLDVQRLTLGLSVDFTISGLSNAASAFGAPELAVQYKFGEESDKGKTICPRF